MKPILTASLVFMLLSALTAQSQSERSVWDGVYTEAQAARGQAVFTTSCASCHAPAEFTGDAFMGAWEASTALDVFSNLQKTMPMDSPGSLRPEEYLDIVAFFFRGNAFPVGKSEMAMDRAQLQLIRIEAKK